MDDTKFKEITELIDNYQNWYWNSDFDDINLIEDLRLSSNIHETAHSRILFKLLKAGKKYGYPLWQEFSNMLDWDTHKVTSFGPPEKYNIDLLIEGEDSKGNKFAVIIENKINHADDQDRQIERYIESVNDKDGIDEWQIYVLYLTRGKNDNGPSENSFSKERQKEFDSRYREISYQVEIRKWIESCKKIWISDLIRSVLIQYGNFLTSMFEPDKEREKAMNENIEKWCFTPSLSSTPSPSFESLSAINNALMEKKKAMLELQGEMDSFLRESVIKKIGTRLDLEEGDPKSSYICFKVEYGSNSLKGHFNFCQDRDGGVWFGIETSKDHKSIKLFKSESMIEGSDAETIIAKFKDKLSGYKNNDSPYLCWQYSTLDTVIDDICSYRSNIEEISDNKQA